MKKLLTTLWGRILLAVILLVVDFAVFFFPIGAVFIVVVVLFRPKWVKNVVQTLYEGKQS